MNRPDRELNRLLARASRAEPEPVPAMPFGFDTRVVALAREKGANAGRESRQLLGLLRRVALTAAIVTAVSIGAAYWQLNQNDDLAEPLSNVYAIADSAIDAEFFQ